MHKLVLVDDDVTFTRVLARAMTARGYRVSVCNSVAAARVRAADADADFVLLDLNIGGENGTVLIDAFTSANPDTRIVIFTAYGSLKSAVWAARHGAADYVAKPADADELDFVLKRTSNIQTRMPEFATPPEEAKEAHILEFFEKNDRRVATTARELGLHRRTLQRILRRLGIHRNGNFKSKATSVGRAKRMMRLWSLALMSHKKPARLGGQSRYQNGGLKFS